MSPSFPRLCAPCAFAVLFAPLPAAAAELPGETLGVVAASSLDGLDETASALLEPWRRRFNGLRPLLKVVAPKLEVADRPIAFGVGQFNGVVTPFAMIPTDEPVPFIEAAAANRVRDVFVASIAGFPVTIQEVEGGVFLTLVRGGRLGQGVDAQPAALGELLDGEEVAVRVTDRGFDYTWRWIGRLGVNRGRLDLSRIRSWKDALAAVPKLGVFAPLFRQLAADVNGATLRFSVDPDGGSLDALLDVDLAKDGRAPRAEPAVAPPLAALVGDREPILTFRSDRPLPPALVRLALAWVESRPDEVEADRFERRTFAAYTESVAELAGGALAVRAALLTPGEGDPLTSNDVALARFRPGTDVVDALRATTEAWNQAVRMSRARTPLLVETAPIEAPAEGDEGLRLTTDVLRAVGGGDLEDVREVFERFYGPGGKHVVDVTPLGDDGRWLRSSLPAADADATRERLAPRAPDADPEDAELNAWLDRWLAWQQRIESTGHAPNAAVKVRPPMAASPPLRMRLNGEGERLRCDVSIPIATYEALAAYWTAEKLDARREP